MLRSHHRCLWGPALEYNDAGLELPEAAPAGIVGFSLHNGVREPWMLRVEGAHVVKETHTPLMPGETRLLKVHLRPGRFRVSGRSGDGRRTAEGTFFVDRAAAERGRDAESRNHH